MRSGVSSSIRRSSRNASGSGIGNDPEEYPEHRRVASGVPPVVAPALACDHRLIPEHAEPAEPTVSSPPPAVRQPPPSPPLPPPPPPPPPGCLVSRRLRYLLRRHPLRRHLRRRTPSAARHGRLPLRVAPRPPSGVVAGTEDPGPPAAQHVGPHGRRRGGRAVGALRHRRQPHPVRVRPGGDRGRDRPGGLRRGVARHPREGTSTSIGRRALADRRTVGLALAFITALVAVLLVLGRHRPQLRRQPGLARVDRGGWPGRRVAGRRRRGTGPPERAHGPGTAHRVPEGRTRRATVARVVVGVVLVAVGLGSLVASTHPTFATVKAVLAVNVVIVGFLVVFGPWWLRLARDLAVERRERVRSEERANMAATVHDSVLQTLALIQRAAGDQGEVTRLARAQERELRAWLFEGRSPGSFNDAEVSTVSQAVSVIERDVEASHRVAVESVTVGDCELNAELRALLAAGREADGERGDVVRRARRVDLRGGRAGPGVGVRAGPGSGVRPRRRGSGPSGHRRVHPGPHDPPRRERGHPQRAGTGDRGRAGHAQDGSRS